MMPETLAITEIQETLEIIEIFKTIDNMIIIIQKIELKLTIGNFNKFRKINRYSYNNNNN